MKNSLDTAFDEGKIEEKRDVVLNSLSIDLDLETISKITGLTVKQIEEIKNNNG